MSHQGIGSKNILLSPSPEFKRAGGEVAALGESLVRDGLL
jgi:hypothetical protein